MSLHLQVLVYVITSNVPHVCCRRYVPAQATRVHGVHPLLTYLRRRLIVHFIYTVCRSLREPTFLLHTYICLTQQQLKNSSSRRPVAAGAASPVRSRACQSRVHPSPGHHTICSLAAGDVELIDAHHTCCRTSIYLQTEYKPLCLFKFLIFTFYF